LTDGDAPGSPLRPDVTLYLIRHGETDWNRDARYQGQTNIPLNALGRAQALRNGLSLKTLLPDIAHADFISSPLDRAIDTMDIIRAAMGLPAKNYRVDAELIELHYGHWEGHLAAELPSCDPEGIAAKIKDPFGWRPRGGESYSDLAKRVRRWLQTLQRDTVAVTHGGVSRVARGAVLQLDTAIVPMLDVPQDRILVLRNGGMQWL
jgi:broad specificity phosphatase PhoE